MGPAPQGEMTTPIEQERAWMAASGMCRACGHLLVFHCGQTGPGYSGLGCIVGQTRAGDFCPCGMDTSDACATSRHAECAFDPMDSVACACRCHPVPAGEHSLGLPVGVDATTEPKEA